MAARYFIDSRFTIFTLLMLSLPHASDSAERMIHHDPLHAGWAGPASLSTSRRGAEVGKPLRDGESYLFEKRRTEVGPPSPLKVYRSVSQPEFSFWLRKQRHST